MWGCQPFCSEAALLWCRRASLQSQRTLTSGHPGYSWIHWLRWFQTNPQLPALGLVPYTCFAPWIGCRREVWVRCAWRSSHPAPVLLGEGQACLSGSSCHSPTCLPSRGLQVARAPTCPQRVVCLLIHKAFYRRYYCYYEMFPEKGPMNCWWEGFIAVRFVDCSWWFIWSGQEKWSSSAEAACDPGYPAHGAGCWMSPIRSFSFVNWRCQGNCEG